MLQTWRLWFFIYAFFYIYNEAGSYFTNFEVKRVEVCSNTQRLVKFYPNIRKENGKQYLTYNLTLPMPVEDNFGLKCLIEAKTLGKGFVELFTIREKNFCKACNKYLGEFWYDIERQSLMTPAVCPIQKGIYHGNHIELDYAKISLQTFPFGNLRFTIEGINNTNKITVWCILVEVENNVN